MMSSTYQLQDAGRIAGPAVLCEATDLPHNACATCCTDCGAWATASKATNASSGHMRPSATATCSLMRCCDGARWLDATAPAGLLEHVQHLRLEHRVDGLHADARARLRHREHVHYLHGFETFQTPRCPVTSRMPSTQIRITS